MTDPVTTDQPLKPVVVSIHEGDPIRPFGLDMRVILTKEDTGGQFSAILAVHQPGQGPISHVHKNQDEYFLVIEGQYEMVIDHGEPIVVGPGALIFLPRGHAHGFKNIGDTPAKVLDWSIPGGQDAYFREISELQAGAGFEGGGMDAVNARHDTQYFK